MPSEISKLGDDYAHEPRHRTFYTITRGFRSERSATDPVYTVDRLEGVVDRLERSAAGTYLIWRGGVDIASAIVSTEGVVLTFPREKCKESRS